MLINIIVSLVLQQLFFYLNKRIDYDYKPKKFFVIGGITLAIIISMKFLVPFCSFKFYPTLVLVLGICLLNITFIDIKYLEIPNTYNAFVFILGLVNMYYYKNIYFLIISAISFILFFILSIFSKGALGGGDIKLSLGLGLFFNLQLFTRFLIFTFGIGALISLILLVLKLKKKEDVIAFGPFMALGAILTFLT